MTQSRRERVATAIRGKRIAIRQGKMRRMKWTDPTTKAEQIVYVYDYSSNPSGYSSFYDDSGHRYTRPNRELTELSVTEDVESDWNYRQRRRQSGPPEPGYLGLADLGGYRPGPAERNVKVLNHMRTIDYMINRWKTMLETNPDAEFPDGAFSEMERREDDARKMHNRYLELYNKLEVKMKRNTLIGDENDEAERIRDEVLDLSEEGSPDHEHLYRYQTEPDYWQKSQDEWANTEVPGIPLKGDALLPEIARRVHYWADKKSELDELIKKAAHSIKEQKAPARPGQKPQYGEKSYKWVTPHEPDRPENLDYE
jgi:hypothetical protein